MIRGLVLFPLRVVAALAVVTGSLVVIATAAPVLWVLGRREVRDEER